MDESTEGHIDEAFVLPSRRIALNLGVRGLADGPVLITGEAGVGKTWLAARILQDASAELRVLTVDVTPTLSGDALVRAIGHRLGMDASRVDRLSLADAMAEESADGRCWGLILDELQLASVEVLEEIRVLSNRLGRPDGFAAIVLVGQTALMRRMSSRSLGALASRLSARLHVRPIDADEAGVLIDRLAPGGALDAEALDRCHRDADGNPRRLLALAAADRGRSSRTVTPSGSRSRSPFDPSGPLLAASEGQAPVLPDIEPMRNFRPEGPIVGLEREPSRMDEPSASSNSSTSRSAMEQVPPFEPFFVRAPFGADRPPLAVDDGMIEVGWDAESDTSDDPRGDDDGPDSDDPMAPEGTHQASIAPSLAHPGADPEIERLADHYAALQAWEEWSRNQQHEAHAPESAGSVAEVFTAPQETDSQSDPRAEGTEGSEVAETGLARANLWAEEQHEFAPYGQLFSKVRQSHESDG